MPGVRRCGSSSDAAANLELSRPASGVAVDRESFAVDPGILAGNAVAKHGAGHAKHSVRGRDDRPFAVAPTCNGLQETLEPAVPGPRRRAGAFDRHRAQSRVAAPRASAAALAASMRLLRDPGRDADLAQRVAGLFR